MQQVSPGFAGGYLLMVDIEPDQLPWMPSAKTVETLKSALAVFGVNWQVPNTIVRI